MILITGGAGFIGSVLHQALAARGEQAVIADRLRDANKWRNLAKHPPGELIAPEALLGALEAGLAPDAIVHLGAISDTTARDGDLAWRTNVGLSQALWAWCARYEVPFLYASSAATYGSGAHGFDDDGSLEYLRRLHPLNLYGWTKHAFDLWVARQLAEGGPAPAHWAGLKFFNVYGPNEYHKGGMVSVVKVKHDEVAAGGAPRLFRSDRAGVADGEQRRDFIWVNDVVEVLLWMLAHPVQGLFNVGTGRARTYVDLAHAVCRAAGRPEAVEFVDMPHALHGQYQSFTEADTVRLRQSGYDRSFTSLEEGIRRYVQDYLRGPDAYV